MICASSPEYFVLKTSKLLSVGPFAISFYALFFIITILFGAATWKWQMWRAGYPGKIANRQILWGALAAVVGARLGHCLVYNPVFYLYHPIEILKIMEGGMASHGATIGMIVMLVVGALRNNARPFDWGDRFMFAATGAVIFVRIGNFLNYEIVGRVTEVSWGIRMFWLDNGRTVRHPVQLYESALGVFTMIILLVVDRVAGKEKRPVGLLTGVFFFVYFGGRFFVEFFKEFESLDPRVHFFTMGQYLSAPAALIGLIVIIVSLKLRIPADRPTSEDDPRLQRRAVPKAQ